MPKPRQGQNAIGGVRPLDATRARRAGAQAAAGQDIASPLELDAQGRRTVALDGPLFENAQGRIDFRAGEGTEVTPGSPRALRMKLASDSGMEFDATGGVKARPTTLHVMLDQTTTLQDELNRIESETAEAILAIPVPVPELVCIAVGVATLVAGTVNVPLPEVLAGAIVIATHQTFAGTPGLLSSVVTAGVGVDLTSASALDTSTVSYAIWNP